MAEDTPAPLKKSMSLKVRRAFVAHEKWADLASVFRAGLFALSARRQAAQRTRVAQDAAEAIETAKCRTTIGEDESVPYWMQGDVSLYSHENLEKRQALRRHPIVVAEL